MTVSFSILWISTYNCFTALQKSNQNYKLLLNFLTLKSLLTIQYNRQLLNTPEIYPQPQILEYLQDIQELQFFQSPIGTINYYITFWYSEVYSQFKMINIPSILQKSTYGSRWSISLQYSRNPTRIIICHITFQLLEVYLRFKMVINFQILTSLLAI